MSLVLPAKYSNGNSMDIQLATCVTSRIGRAGLHHRHGDRQRRSSHGFDVGGICFGTYRVRTDGISLR